MVYELMVVVKNEEALLGVKELFKKEIKSEEVWGKRRLAYRIGPATDGYYAVYQLELVPSTVKNLSKELTASKEVLRYLFNKV